MTAKKGIGLALGSTSTSRTEIIQGIALKIARALEERPEEVTGVIAIVIRRPRYGDQSKKALQCGVVWGREAWKGLVELTAAILKAMGEQIAVGEGVQEKRRDRAREN